MESQETPVSSDPYRPSQIVFPLSFGESTDFVAVMSAQEAEDVWAAWEDIFSRITRPIVNGLEFVGIILLVLFIMVLFRLHIIPEELDEEEWS